MAIGFGNNLTEEELLKLGIESGATGPISGDVINDYILDPDSGGEGITIEDLTTGDIETLGDVGTDDELETQDNLTENLNWMQENAPEWFSDWLYEAERPDLGSVDLSSTFGSPTEDAVTELGSESGIDRLSDLGRAAIQSGAYVGDFWKDLAMAPYRLFQGEGFKDQYEHLIDNPQWAEDIGYESDYGQAVMDNPAVRGFQEHILPFAGAGIIGAASRIPAAGKIFQMMYPTTSAMAKMGKAKVKDYAGIIGRALYGKPWGPMLPKPGSLAFNIGLPYAFGQGQEKIEGRPSAFDVSGAVDYSPVSSAHAADVPTPVRAPSNRAMIEMANTRRPGPRDDYRGL